MNPRRRRHQRTRRHTRVYANRILADLAEIARACPIDLATNRVVWVRDVDTGEESFMRAADADRLRAPSIHFSNQGNPACGADGPVDESGPYEVLTDKVTCENCRKIGSSWPFA